MTSVSYDIRWCVETVRANNDGERFVVVHTPEHDSPTYNYRDMFVACMGWDYSQGEYYPMADVLPKLRQGLDELTKHPERYRQYEPRNGWGTLKGAVMCLRNWIDELTNEDNWDCVQHTWPLDTLWWRW